MMKRYRLKKDLPTFEAGNDGFYLDSEGNLMNQTGHTGTTVIPAAVLVRNPNILTDWFEEIPEESKTVRDLETGDKVWYIVENGNINWIEYVGDCSLFSRALIQIGNAFLTEEEARKELARRKAKVILERDTKGFKPSNESNWEYWSVYYDPRFNGGLATCIKWGFDGALSFATEEDAEASIKAHPEEWKIYLGVEE